MAVNSGQFAELLWPSIREIFGNNLNRYKPLWKSYFTVKKSDLAFEKYQGVTGLGLAQVKAQGRPVAYADPLLGFQNIITPRVYALGMSVTREMYRDDQYNYINDAPKMLQDAIQQTREVVCASVLNNGFNTSFTQNGGDGKPLFSTSHPLVDGSGNFKNTPTTAADLTQASVEQMGIDLGNLVDDRGRNIMVKPKKMIIPVDLQFQAQKVLKTEYEVDSGNNTINPVQGMMDFTVVPYLTDTDAWFVTTSVPDGLVYQDRDDVELDRDNEFDTFNLKFVASVRFGVSWVQTRGIYGSPGA